LLPLIQNIQKKLQNPEDVPFPTPMGFLFSINSAKGGETLKRVVKHWHRLPRDVVDAPSLETFKARLVGSLSNLI